MAGEDFDRGMRTTGGGAPTLPALAAVACLCVLPIVSTGCSQGDEEEQQPPRQAEPAARVNGVDIPERMVQEALDLYLMQRPAGSADVSDEKGLALRAQVVELLITQEVLAQRAEAEGVRVEDSEIEQRLQLMESRYGSREQMLQGLEQAGITEQGIRNLLKRALMMEKFLERQVNSQVSVSDADAEAFYRTHPEEMKEPPMLRASHILVMAQEGNVPPEERQRARASARELLERLRQGENFAELARQHSDDGSAARGGDLGFFPRGKMTPNFEQVAFELDPGQLSGVVETPYGYHIIKVTDKRPGRTLEFDEVRIALRRQLEAMQREQRTRDLLQSLHGEARIERFGALQ